MQTIRHITTCPRSTGTLVFLAVAVFALTTVVRAQEADVKTQLQWADLTGMELLTSSLGGKLAAGRSWHSNPPPASGSFSLIKVWSIKDRKLLNEFRVPREVYALTFTSDDSTIIAADRRGNLGTITTLTAWNLADGTERKIGECAGRVIEFRHSPDGTRLATPTEIGWNWVSSCIAQIIVWPMDGKEDALSIDIHHPLGERTELRPVIEDVERVKAVLKRVIPSQVRFSAAGKHLVCETKAGCRTIYDSTTGELVQHAGTSSIDLFKSMLMIALSEVSKEATAFTLELTPYNKPVLVKRAADGWWRIGDSAAFKVDGEHFLSQIKGVERKDRVLMLLGLKSDATLSKVSSIKHPFGAIKVNRAKTGLTFRLEEETGEQGVGKPLQTGKVLWASSVKE